MKISICSVTYFRKDSVVRWFENLLETLDYENHTYEIFVHDNASTDGTYEYLEKKNLCNLCRSEVNIGKPKALNQLFEKCTGDMFVSTDSDIIVESGWENTLLDVFKDYEKIGIASPYYRDNGNSPIMECDKMVMQDSKRDVFFFMKDLKYNIAGGFLMMLPEAFKNAGGYREDGMYGGNDAVLNRKMVEAGYKCVYTKRCFVEHLKATEEEREYELWKQEVNRKKRENGDYVQEKGFWG